MRGMEDERIKAHQIGIIAEQFARIDAAKTRYSIRDASRIMNLDESGVAISCMVGKKPPTRAWRKEEIVLHCF